MPQISKPLIHKDPVCLPGERYLPAPGYPGYLTSNLGNIFSLARSLSRGPGRGVGNTTARKLLPSLDTGGYLKVNLYITSDIYVTRNIHQLVLEAFVGPRRINRVVDHVNCIRTDNYLGNLRYVSAAFNNLNHAKDSVWFVKKTNTWRWAISYQGSTRGRSRRGYRTKLEAQVAYQAARRELLAQLLAESIAEDLAADIAEGRVRA